jgi:hypothetical protein
MRMMCGRAGGGALEDDLEAEHVLKGQLGGRGVDGGIRHFFVKTLFL